jgi:hypothetical protein
MSKNTTRLRVGTQLQWIILPPIIKMCPLRVWRGILLRISALIVFRMYKKNQRWGDIDHPQLPYFSNYRVKSILEYHSFSQNFRTIKYDNKYTTVLDGSRSATIIKDRKDTMKTLQ